PLAEHRPRAMAFADKAWQLPQLYQPDCSGDLGRPYVEAGRDEQPPAVDVGMARLPGRPVRAPARPAVGAKGGEGLGPARPVRRVAPPALDRRHVVREEKAERAQIAEGADGLAADARAGSLATILDDPQAVTPRDLDDRGHVARIAENVNDNNGLRARRNR